MEDITSSLPDLQKIMIQIEKVRTFYLPLPGGSQLTILYKTQEGDRQETAICQNLTIFF
jgi:hypothetical protein